MTAATVLPVAAYLQAKRALEKLKDKNHTALYLGDVFAPQFQNQPEREGDDEKPSASIESDDADDAETDDSVMSGNGCKKRRAWHDSPTQHARKKLKSSDSPDRPTLLRGIGNSLRLLERGLPYGALVEFEAFEFVRLKRAPLEPLPANGKQLQALCAPSAFGDLKTQTTTVDPAVRLAFELAGDQLQLTERAVSFLDAFSLHVSRYLYAGRPVRLHLSKLNVYPKRGKFQAHVDTPRPNMVGTVLVELPYKYRGGAFKLWPNKKACAEQAKETTEDAHVHPKKSKPTGSKKAKKSASTQASEYDDESNITSDDDDDEDDHKSREAQPGVAIVKSHWWRRVKQMRALAFYGHLPHAVCKVTQGHRVTLLFYVMAEDKNQSGTLLPTDSGVDPTSEHKTAVTDKIAQLKATDTDKTSTMKMDGELKSQKREPADNSDAFGWRKLDSQEGITMGDIQVSVRFYASPSASDATAFFAVDAFLDKLCNDIEHYVRGTGCPLGLFLSHPYSKSEHSQQHWKGVDARLWDRLQALCLVRSIDEFGLIHFIFCLFCLVSAHGPCGTASLGAACGGQPPRDVCVVR